MQDENGYWLPKPARHMPLKGHLLIPDLACPIFEEALLVTQQNTAHLCRLKDTAELLAKRLPVVKVLPLATPQ